jgi:hypothetical protein
VKGQQAVNKSEDLVKVISGEGDNGRSICSISHPQCKAVALAVPMGLILWVLKGSARPTGTTHPCCIHHSEIKILIWLCSFILCFLPVWQLPALTVIDKKLGERGLGTSQAKRHKRHSIHSQFFIFIIFISFPYLLMTFSPRGRSQLHWSTLGPFK